MTEDPDTLMTKGLLLRTCVIVLASAGSRSGAPRARGEIPLHAQRVLQRCVEWTKIEGPIKFSEAALALLCEAEYDGNVRPARRIVRFVSDLYLWRVQTM